MKNLHWLLRRELWEHRSLYGIPALLALLIVGCVAASLALHGRSDLSLVAGDGPAALRGLRPADWTVLSGLLLLAVAAPFFGVAFLLQGFYALDALHGERQDRSLLFWKSLPPGDGETVLAKFLLAVLGIPLLSLAVAIAVQLAVALLLTVPLWGTPLLAGLWNPLGWLSAWLLCGYGVLVGALWYAPLLAAALALGAAVPRLPMLWGLLVPAAAMLAEKLVWGTHALASGLNERVFGVLGAGFRTSPGLESLQLGPGHVAPTLLSLADPAGLLANGAMWAGLAVAAGCLVLAAWIRRHRESWG